MFILISILFAILVIILVIIKLVRDDYEFLEVFMLTLLLILIMFMFFGLLNVIIFYTIEYEHVEFISAKKELYPNAYVKIISNKDYEDGYYLQSVRMKDNHHNNIITLWKIDSEEFIEKNKLYLNIHKDNESQQQRKQ